MSDPMPLIAVSACLKDIGGHPTHTVGEKYLTAVAVGAGGTPVIVPALGSASISGTCCAGWTEWS
jgi:putative glutamine amidotransferase